MDIKLYQVCTSVHSLYESIYIYKIRSDLIFIRCLSKNGDTSAGILYLEDFEGFRYSYAGIILSDLVRGKIDELNI